MGNAQGERIKNHGYTRMNTDGGEAKYPCQSVFIRGLNLALRCMGMPRPMGMNCAFQHKIDMNNVHIYTILAHNPVFPLTQPEMATYSVPLGRECGKWKGRYFRTFSNGNMIQIVNR
jgi:hypothetical protein